MIADTITERLGDCVLIPVPKGGKGPKIKAWQKLTLSDMTAEHYAKLDGQNIGVLLGSASNHLISIDADSDDFLESFLSVNPLFRESLISRGARGGNVWLRVAGEYPRTGKIKNADSSPWGEFRADGSQTVFYGQHPSGCSYTNNGKLPLSVEFGSITWPEELILPWAYFANSLISHHLETLPAVSVSLFERARAYVAKMPVAIQGQGGSDATFAVAKKLIHDFALPEADAWHILLEYNSRCSPPWSEAELRHKLEDASKCNRSLVPRGELATSILEQKLTRSCEISEISEISDPYFANSLNSQGEPPCLENLSVFGLAGQIVAMIEPHTETHPASLLVQLLVGFGNMVGRGPYFLTERDKQHTNIFCVIVGDSSRGRKGTSWGHVKHILSKVELSWCDERIMSGIASGEGVIAQIADPIDGEKAKVRDKRLQFFEGEFAQVLKVAQRHGNTISAILRNAWDSGELRNLSKGAPLRASGCHISLIGHITRNELKSLLTANDAGNGFANRILWTHSSRTKLLPDGGEIGTVDFGEVIKSLQAALALARTRTEIKRSLEASKYWHAIYPKLTEELHGRWGEVTSRGEAQVVRLSLLFSLLEGCQQIELAHLKAAEALWNYCRDSARWAFMESTLSSNAQKLMIALEHSDGLTRTQIMKGVFSGHIPAKELNAAIKEIDSLIDVTPMDTGGAPADFITLRNKRNKRNKEAA